MKTKQIKRFFCVLILMVCLMATTSCSDDKSLPELIFDSETLFVSGQGEEAVLTYQALSWPQGAELSVSCDQDWLHDFDSSTPGELHFIVDPAPYAETKRRQAVPPTAQPSAPASPCSAPWKVANKQAIAGWKRTDFEPAIACRSDI